jgi:hypothetical protein
MIEDSRRYWEVGVFVLSRDNSCSDLIGEQKPQNCENDEFDI